MRVLRHLFAIFGLYSLKKPRFARMNRLESYFLPKTSSLSSASERTARLLIRFNVISIVFAIGYFFNTFATGFIVSRYTMVVALVLFTLIITALKKGILSLRTASVIFTAACWLLMFVLSFFSGGIKSSILPWITLIPVLALALLNGKIALWWAIAGVATVLFFFNFDVTRYVPAHLLTEPNDLLIASVHIGLQFIILSIFYIFERQQTNLINQLEDARNIIQHQNEQLQIKNDYLESEISKRTSQLVNYNQQLEQFAFMASHNLRAPIARLIGLGDIFNKSQSLDDQEFIRTRMLEATRELDHVVRDMNSILDVQKNRTISLTNIALRGEVEHVLSTLKREVEATTSNIQIEIDPHLTLTCIKAYFQSIVYNLVSNAIKYRKPNTPATITISAALDGDFVLLTVADNGLGIDLEKSGGKIFNLYSRFHEGVDGKGIGLYMVKIQSEAMGGSVQVDSAPGKGCTFTVRISRNLQLI
jgi:signal transduction histidine kinase